jgi:ATP-binding cassette subfamily B multidrug efflux pump
MVLIFSSFARKKVLMGQSADPGRNGSRPRNLPGGGRSPAQPRRIEKARNPSQALGRFLPYLRPSRLTIALIFLDISVYTLLDLLGPYLMGVGIDRFIATKNASGLARIAGLMFGIFLLDSILQAIGDFTMARVSQRALQQVRLDLFEHLQKLSLRFYDRIPAGELMSRLTNDIDAINQAVSQNATALLSGLLTLLGILIAMFVLNHWLALASILVVPLTFWFTSFIARYTRHGFQRLQRELGNLNGTMEETISGQRVVKAFLRNDWAVASFRRDNEAVYQAGVYANSYALLLMPLTNILGNLFVIVLAGFGGWLAIQGLVTIGMIATFISYGRRFIQPLRQLANIYNDIQAALAGAERVFEIIDTQPEMEDSPEAYPLDSIRGDVRFDHVKFGYLPEVPVIRDMSLVAHAGQTIALVGPTGAGKTTLVNLLSRFYDVDHGTISVDEIDIRRVQKRSLRCQLGIVLQDTFLFSKTVMENIRYGRMDASDEECVQAARLAEADSFIRQLHQGYQTQLSERGSNLSQGQRQLLTIARAILANPRILILDEATSSVDTRTEARIQKAMLRLMAGRTSFVIAHRLSTIREADELLVIRDGEIVERGSHAQLLAQQGFYYHLYLSQFKGHAI